MISSLVLVISLFSTAVLFMLAGIFAHRAIVKPILYRDPVIVHPQPVNVEVDMAPFVREVQRIPSKVLQSVQGSVNANKGVLGELVSVLKLRAEYDRIIPIGNIADFICIKLPTESREGTIDFVEVKSGGRKRLTAEQKALQKLVEEKKVQFVKVEVETTIASNK